ncbi:SDR family oxidoreductase [Modestobacter sp. VKM Ac-2979]|uniref:SDR family NAD(P)-dependent oxidoreductase n=1 Tax=unclassified Modestobacter TaxID=2643866 RepID=UPI0022AB8D9A|nr:MULTISPECIES: SDR family oxidoreductase [unclassified Modestobacter]MCZ2813293.1 SDR family oxidoreductase [Modestobacter sp. VKM Ac-2979]MCZ2842515.1 SDR family oxidoreductase [Modestobacter sp. VKM Ac-2980]
MSGVDWRGQTTLVTGASAGIGAEFARQLAARGSHLVLVARRADRLESLAAELTATHGVTVSAVPLDLARPAAGRALAAEVDRRGLPVTSVVNCAGFGTYGPFVQEDADRLAEMIAVDVTALVDVSRAFIDRLRAAGSGVLVNVASMAAYAPSPEMAVYAASKAFVLSFTEALWQESLASGLRVLALSPGATDTEFFDVVGDDAADGGRGRQAPGQVVDTALRALDRRNPPPSVAVGRLNSVAATGIRLLSRRRTVLAMAGVVQRGAVQTADR